MFSKEYFIEHIHDGFMKKWREGRLPAEGFSINDYRERIKKEYAVIVKNNFVDYFLIVEDICQFAHKHKIAMGYGRGSAGGSLIGYLLEIHHCDPIRYGLHFERFLNESRISPPDIDLDFSSVDREEVFQYVKEKYGITKTARIGTLQAYKIKNMVKDLCRAYEIDFDRVNDAIKDKEYVAMDDLKEDADIVSILESIPDWEFKLESLGALDRQTGVHACGVVLSDIPITHFPLSQYKSESLINLAMSDVDALGLLKMDLLGIGTLDVITHVVKSCKPDLDIYNLDTNVDGVYKLFEDGYTAGIFQCSGYGITQAIKKIKPKNILELADVLALYRPGAKDFIDTYVYNKDNPENPQFLHELLKEMLEETHHVLVYQEQIMNIFMVLGGFSLAEADVIRKGIGKKKADLMEWGHKELIKRIGQTTADELWELIKNASNYSFNKSHAVAYALLSYLTAYLKYHYPVDFYVALLNNTDDVKKINIYINEAFRMGIKIKPPDLANASLLFSKSKTQENTIYSGIVALKGVSEDVANTILNYFVTNGQIYIWDFLQYCLASEKITKRAIEPLILMGFFDGIPFSDDYKEVFYTRMTLANNIEGVLKILRSQKTRKKPDDIPTQKNRIMELMNVSSGEISAIKRIRLENEICGYTLPYTFSLFYNEVAERPYVKKHKLYESLADQRADISLVQFIGACEKRPNRKTYKFTNHVSEVTGLFEWGSNPSFDGVLIGVFEARIKNGILMGVKLIKEFS